MAVRIRPRVPRSADGLRVRARTLLCARGGSEARTSVCRLDLFWGPACAPRSTAVIHAHAFVHADGGSHSRRPNAVARGGVEAVLLKQRLLARGLAILSSIGIERELTRRSVPRSDALPE